MILRQGLSDTTEMPRGGPYRRPALHGNCLGTWIRSLEVKTTCVVPESLYPKRGELYRPVESISNGYDIRITCLPKQYRMSSSSPLNTLTHPLVQLVRAAYVGLSFSNTSHLYLLTSSITTTIDSRLHHHTSSTRNAPPLRPDDSPLVRP